MEIYTHLINSLLIVLLIVVVVLVAVITRFMWNATLLVKALWSDLEVLIETLRNANEITDQVKDKLQIVNDTLPVDSVLSFFGMIMNLIVTWRRGGK